MSVLSSVPLGWAPDSIGLPYFVFGIERDLYYVPRLSLDVSVIRGKDK